MKKFLLFCAGLVLGTGIGLSLKAVPAFNALLTRNDLFTRCPTEISTLGWQTFRSSQLGYSLRYSSDWTLKREGDTITLEATTPEADGVRETIVLEKLRTSLSSVTSPDMRQASWKIADRQVYALTTPYFTSDDRRTLSEEYVFIRDFPARQTDGTFTVVRATITMSPKNDSLLAAKSAKVLDPETILIRPEEILSTFRFLQFDELPGRDGGGAG
jgi:hypothetical protein